MNVERTTPTRGLIQAWQNQVAPGPLGTVGNLRFGAKDGGTVRADRIGLVQHARDFLDKLTFRFSAPEEARMARAYQNEININSRRIGNLLGSLTARFTEAGVLDRIAGELGQIGRLSQGDLFSMPGGQQSLLVYLAGMTSADLAALRDGVLGCPGACDEVLARVEPKLQQHAAAVLEQMENALRVRLADAAVTESLSELVRLLSAGAVDGQALRDQLVKWHTGLAMLDFSGVAGRLPAMSMLDDYFRYLWKYDLQVWLMELRFERLAAAHSALSQLDDDSRKHQALVMLDRLKAALGQEMYVRSRPKLEQLRKGMDRAEAAQDELDAEWVISDVIYLWHQHRPYGWMPRKMADEMRQLTHRGMNIINAVASGQPGESKA
ncbi:hypothetical protein [Alcaligenes sp. WGS1538]|uniref:hypothetical protein n=1 Tax=Alcaligenes sp. WGS1538 TaxID=3366811 RepID=UPI00372D1903